MDERERAEFGMDGIQRLRDRVRELKALILSATGVAPPSAVHEAVQQEPQEGYASYMEIRPRGDAPERDARRKRRR